LAHNTNRRSIIAVFTAALLSLGATIGEAAEPCQSPPPRGISFTGVGPENGPFVLSMAMPSRKFVMGAKVPVVLRLQTVQDASVTLFSALPYGDYQLAIYNVGTHHAPTDRAGHVQAISQLAMQHLSAQCPNYEEFDLNWLYNLGPGTYSVTASRRPQRMISMQPLNVESLPIVVSNEVRFRVDP